METNDYITTLIKGAISGGLSRTIASPFEVVKIYHQTNKFHGTSIVNCMRFIYSKRGWKGFFKGNGANMYRAIPNYALNFLIFEKMKDPVLELIPNRDIANLFTGSLSGAMSISAVYPLETVRTYMTMDKKRFPNITTTIRDIVSRSGIRGLYKGLSMSILNVGPYIGINFAVFHGLDDLYKTNNPIIHFLYGCVSGTTSVIFTFPTDLVRNRMHIQKSPLWKGEHYSNIFDAVKSIYIKEGVLGFYKGSRAAMVRVSVSMGIMFMVNRMLSTLS